MEHGPADDGKRSAALDVPFRGCVLRGGGLEGERGWRVGAWRIYENRPFWVSFFITFWRPFWGPIWDPSWAPWGVFFGVFFEDNVDTDFGPDFGPMLDPFWTLSGAMSGFCGHVKTIKKPCVFVGFLAMPGFKRHSTGHQRPYKHRACFQA